MRQILMLSLILAGCTNAGAEAEERYQMVKRTGTNGEICDAARDVAATYLREGDEEEYRLWHTHAGINCMTAKYKGRDSFPETPDRNEANEDAQQAMEAMQEAADRVSDPANDE
ncbi:hypothetical protein P7228_05745 [Altererythrobacter arenosus]|uniref:UrcA family protein n=1 Tax=Altererythrobacter arenosus TaxID=3032592 RepID=A0ABY8FU75_9SPHN|nr:hypothetical protein [Altererythrobacter sp. CAU 1644]WFL78567.1 hypothetical protein P7228_05745 [Altererythrobacter sp. CAU 1644]